MGIAYYNEGTAWLSTARAVECDVNSLNEQNSLYNLVISWWRLSQYGLYRLGDTRATSRLYKRMWHSNVEQVFKIF